MANTADDDLQRRTWELLQPGEISLDGCIVRTELDGGQEPEMHQATIEVGECIASVASYEPGDTFVYSGSDDSEFASNQHQGLTIENEEFVWECQQLLRNGSFDLVFYFEAAVGAEPVQQAVREAGYDATGIEGSADSAAEATLE